MMGEVKMERVRTVVGIDPGTKKVGYAVIAETNAGWRVVDSGVFQFSSRLSVHQRLAMLYEDLLELLQDHLPDCLIVEEPHVRPFGMKSALVVAQSVGVVKLAAVKAGIPVVSFPYTQAKRILTGSGSSSREVLAAAVQQILELPELPPWQDAIDAMAFALCYCLLTTSTRGGASRKMIGRLKGRLVERHNQRLVIDVNGVGYEVFVPGVVARWAESLKIGDEVELVTLYLLQMEPGRATPMLLGFRNELEREFFERLLSVPKLGVRGALQLFAVPMATLARAIEDNDQKALMKLPGVGRQRARELIAALQGKVAKFALLAEEEVPTPLITDVVSEALEILQSLGYTRTEAQRMIDAALERLPKPSSTEELIRTVYQVQREKRE
jgi:Holliday junction DNA helicase RuvA subunit/crossover junction endodeoxyribonuclease RuvC